MPTWSQGVAVSQRSARSVAAYSAALDDRPALISTSERT